MHLVKRKIFYLLSLFILVCACHLRAQVSNPLFIATAHATPDTICQGQFTQLSVTIQGGPGPFTYLWSPAATLNNPAISNPQATPLVNTLYQVTVTDQWMNTSKDSIMVYVETIPLPPSAVTGPTHVCSDSVCTYSVEAVSGATSYSWTVPAGATILSGQNTRQISLEWGNNGGTVSVIVGNKCGTSVPSVLSVSVTPTPLTSLAIFGPSHLCQADTGEFYTDTITFASQYRWTVPQDAFIISGMGTTLVRVKWGMTAGEISVSGVNSCGSGPALSKTVLLDSLPASAGPITGPDTVCIAKGSYNYSITPLIFASYYGWTLPQGAVITSGQHTNRITVEFGINSIPGPVTAFGINACGNGQASIKQVIPVNCSGIAGAGSPLVSISPNPVSGILSVHISKPGKKYQITIGDQLGRVVYDNCLEGSGDECIHKVDVSSFPKGMFFLRIFNENGSSVVKVLVR